MNLLTLDFVTYFDDRYTMKNLMVSEYVLDPRFHINGLAIRHPDGKTEFCTDVNAAIVGLKTLYGENLERAVVICHNAIFDLFILQHRLGIRVAQFIDTMLLANNVLGRDESVSRASLASHLGLQAKGDSAQFRDMRDPNPLQMARLAEFALHDVGLTYQIVLQLLQGIKRIEIELPLMQHTVRLYLERPLRIDVDGLDKLSQQIADENRLWLESCQAYGLRGGPEQIRSDREFGKLLKAALARTGRELPLKKGSNGPIPAIAKTDEEMQVLAHDDDPVVEALVNTRLNMKSEDQLQARLGKMRRITKATGGFLHPQLIYCGASRTKRFSGGGGLNLQNMGSEGIGGRVRSLILPAVGKQFIIADYASIEPRVLALLAGEKELLKQFAAGVDIYSVFATNVFKREVRKPTDDDDIDLKARLKADRQVGKEAILGLGVHDGLAQVLKPAPHEE